MAEWLVELRGHEFDLKTLAVVFTTNDCLIFEEGGEFRLKSNEFDDLGGDAEVYERAKSLMVDINGITNVYEHGYRNVNPSGGIISVGADGTRKRYIHVAVSDTLRLSDSVEADGGVADVKGRTPADQAIKAARKEEVVSRVLQFFSQATNWVNLYKVLDAIREDLGGELKAVEHRGWVAANDIGRFTGTANNHTAAAGEARHGFDYGRAMANPMTLAEADEIIRTLLREWLKTKNQLAVQGPPSSGTLRAWVHELAGNHTTHHDGRGRDSQSGNSKNVSPFC